MDAEPVHNPVAPQMPQTATGRVWSVLVLYAVVPLTIAALMAYYLVISRRVVGEIGFPLDDSWIHVRFAQNLARGYGFSFNPGQPASTTTGALWTVLLALGYRVTGEYLLTAAALNWIICCLCALAVSSLARTFVPRPSFGAAAAIIFAVTAPLPWLALSGMEPPLFALATLVGILLHVRFRREWSLKSLLPTAVFATAVYARPECLLLFPLAMLDRLLMACHEDWGKKAALSWLKGLALQLPVYLAIVAPLSLYNYNVIGRPLPSSYYIKAWNYGITWALATGNDSLLMQSLFVAPVKEVGGLLWMWAGNNAALIIPFLVGFVWMLRRMGRPEVVRHRSYLIPLVLIVQPVAWAVSTSFHRAPWFQGQRYVANLGPLELVLGLVGGLWLVERVPVGKRRLLIGLGIVLAVISGLARQPSQARLYAQNVKNITELQVTTARWLKQHVPQDALLAANDVGAVAVITGCRVFDMMGLVSPETISCLTLENAMAGTVHSCLREKRLAAKPDYLVAVAKRERLPALLRDPTYLAPIYTVEIDDNITAGGPMAVVIPTIWCKYPVGMPRAGDM